jgi:uncharacterized membrane-anchored protein
MRKLLIICAACLQVLALASIRGQREYVLRTGKTIYLRTVPVDPRDIFRGDYVRLRYEISSIDKKYFRDGLAAEANDTTSRRYKGKPVYVVLAVDNSNLANIIYVTDKKPAKGELYIRGRANQDYYDSSYINVLYGIEAYFVEQGEGKQLEKLVSRSSRTAFDMEIALGSNGIAVLKSYRCGPITIKLQNIEQKDGVVQSCQLVLTNVSDKPVAIVDLPDYGSLKLDIWSGTSSKKFSWANKNASVKMVEDKDVHILQPSQNYEFNINFNDPYWSVIDTEKGSASIVIKMPERSNNWFMPLFSLVYEPPSDEMCKGLKDASLIWHGRLTVGSLGISRRD